MKVDLGKGEDESTAEGKGQACSETVPGGHKGLGRGLGLPVQEARAKSARK